MCSCSSDDTRRYGIWLCDVPCPIQFLCCYRELQEAESGQNSLGLLCGHNTGELWARPSVLHPHCSVYVHVVLGCLHIHNYVALFSVNNNT